MATSSTPIIHCENCHRELASIAYELQTKKGRLPHCLTCALRWPPLVKRSLVICVLVGTLVTAINQGNFIVSGDFQQAMAWKIPLTYMVPFVVAITGGLLNVRVAIKREA